MTNNNRIVKGTIFLKILLVCLFAWALMPNPYGYFVLLRWISCPAFAYLAVSSYQRQSVPWVWIFGVLAGIYNPIIKTHLGRELWIIVNVISIILIIAHSKNGQKATVIRNKKE